MTDYFDRNETRPRKTREAAIFRDFKAILSITRPHASALRKQTRDIDITRVRRCEDLGMVVAGERRDVVRTVLLSTDDTQALTAAADALTHAAQAELPHGRIEVHADCRYVGQSHALTVPWHHDAPGGALAQAFHAAHAHASGAAMPDRPVEVVSLRVAAITDGPDLPWSPRPLADGVTHGPAALPMAGSTCWVAEGWMAQAHEDGTITMERA